MRRFGQLVSALIAAFMIGLAANPTAAAGAKNGTTAPIYVFRGGLNIFSTGMDTLARELTAKGIPAVSDTFEDWRDDMAKVVAAYQANPYPIVIIGHSYGANSALLMAYELAKSDIPVSLLVFYDLTDTAKVPPNVDHVLNFRSSSSTGIDVTVTGGTYFAGTIENVTRPDLIHINIDKAEDLHKQTIDEIVSLLRTSSRTAKQ